MPQDPDKLIREVGARLFELRVGAGMTQAEVATKLRCSEQYVRRLERGENLTLRKIVELTNLYDVPASTLLAKPQHRVVTPGRPKKPQAP
jgi:transcriptional regulator with XRE-family HTH domain